MKLWILLALFFVSFELTTSQYPIKNVVVLMLENRSFDHMLGFLKRVNPEIDGLNGNETNPIDTADRSKGYVKVNDEAPNVARWDPDHSLIATSEKIFGEKGKGSNPAPMDGFVQVEIARKSDPASDVMNMFTPAAVPIISTLATEFALFDRWFASVPGPTHPNRLFALTCTSYGTINNDVPKEGLPQTTLFQRLEQVNKTWNMYYTDQIWALMLSEMRSADGKKHLKTWDTFLSDAKEGKLPNYSWLEPRFAPTKTLPPQDQHPDHPVNAGEGVMKEVYEALRASPQWNDLLLIVTYDEHGGFYDHYPTPQDGVPNPDGRHPDPPLPSKFDFDRSGIRVPAIAISPWINKGVVVHGPKGPTPTSQYEHSSIAATVKKLFGTKTFLTKRDEWAGTFEDLFTQRTTPRTDCPMTLPAVKSLTDEELLFQANLPANELQCDYIKAFPGSHGNCNMTQEEIGIYSIALLEKFLNSE